MTSLLKTMAVRQEEGKTPYTDQLVRFRDELQDIMMNPNIDPRSKLKLLNDKGSTYRDMLRRSRNLRRIQGTPPQPTTTPTPPASAPPASTTPRVQQRTPVRPFVTRSLPLTPPSTVKLETPHLPKDIAQARRLIEAKKELVRELQKSDKKKQRDSGVSPVTPPARRTRTQTRRKADQHGSGLYPFFGSTMAGLDGWQKVRFLRK